MPVQIAPLLVLCTPQLRMTYKLKSLLLCQLAW